MPPGRKSGRIAFDITVEAGDWLPLAELRRLARRAINAAAGGAGGVTRTVELSLLFTDDRHMRVLNRSWRKVDKSTNVLSFPSPRQSGSFPPFLGDIALAFETIDRESRRQGLTFEDHLTHLIVHGYLHLLGFDHAKNDEAERMEGLETAILGGLGIKDPYRAPGG